MAKSILVTGASRGIGKAIAILFARNGYNVIINCKNSKDKLLSLKKEIEDQNVKCLAFVGDIGDYNFVKMMINESISHFGKIDVVVNNAAISYVGLLSDMDINDWDNIIKTNLTSVFNCCSLVTPNMITNKSGAIINISSVWGEVGASCEVAYSASKGGVNAFTKALAKELAPSNIKVNAISCGAIDTEMNSFLDDDDKNNLINEIPANRLGTPEEVAKLVYTLATNESIYLTGQVIRFDGGWI